jgi:pimeloyl-ACP methyl ester carboxylesterase
VFARLASKTYDWDDNVVADIGMSFFSGIDDIKRQDFSTPNYRRIGSGGNRIDWWGSAGNDFGLDYTLFQNRETGSVVVAFRGTEPLSLEDWRHDVEQAILGSSEQYQAAVKLAMEMKERLDAQRQRNDDNGTKKQELYFVGHSLGGGLATAAALATGKEAIVFDAAGVSDETIEDLQLQEKKNENASKVTNFNVTECFVSDWYGKKDKMDRTTLGTIGDNVCRQYGHVFWLQSISERADFKILPDWFPAVKLAESVLNHAWHVFTYQLEHKNFEDVSTSDKNPRPTKKLRM